MKEYFRRLKKDRLVVRLFIISFIILVTNYIVIAIAYTKLPPLLPIFNQFPWGEQRLAATPGILFPPLIATFYFILNIFLSAFSYEKYPLIARIFAVTTSLIGLLTLLFVIRTITLIL